MASCNSHKKYKNLSISHLKVTVKAKAVILESSLISRTRVKNIGFKGKAQSQKILKFSTCVQFKPQYKKYLVQVAKSS